MVNDILNSINKELNKLIGLYEIDNSIDYSTILIKLCKDELLKLIDEETSVILNNVGDVDIKRGDLCYNVDIKIQDINKTYSFPNLTSIKKVKDTISNFNNHIIYVFVEYEIGILGKIRIDKITVRNIEDLDWSYLYIQNIGRGQLQIKNITREEFKFNNEITRTEWLRELKTKSIEYYNNLILKITEYKSDWEDG